MSTKVSSNIAILASPYTLILKCLGILTMDSLLTLLDSSTSDFFFTKCSQVLNGPAVRCASLIKQNLTFPVCKMD